MDPLYSLHCFHKPIREDCDLDLQFRLTANLAFHPDIGCRASQRTPRSTVVISDVPRIYLPQGRLERGEMCFGDEDFKHLKWFRAKFNMDRFTGIVLYTGNDVLSFGNHMYAVPFANLT